MEYTRENLQLVAHSILEIARKNLQRDGYLSPVGLIFHKDGISQIFQFTFSDVDEKRQSQEAFRDMFKTVGGRAAVIVTESWLKVRSDSPLDPTQSIVDDPDRKEVIVIEAASSLAKVFITQTFARDSEGKIHFEPPFEPEYGFTWHSEWLDGIGYDDGGRYDS